MMVQSFKESSNITVEAWFVLAISPITCPIIIGMAIADKD
jgi:hypothetical protein